MLYITFLQKLKKLNPRIFVVGNETGKPWGIYLYDHYGKEEPKHMCGINANSLSIDEFTHRRWDGYILHQGWRRILKILAEKKAVNLRKAEQVFGTNLRGRFSRGVIVEKDPLTKAIDEAKERSFRKSGVADSMEVDDLVDIHRWREQLRQDKSNYWA